MNKKKIINLLSKKFFIFFLFFTPTAFAECNFKTGEYIQELSNPKYIKKISIKVPNYRKYIINFARIISHSSDIIPTSLKKTFKAKVNVSYPFGECEYSGEIKQHGDANVDHITFNNSKPLRSIGVKLDEGNIMNAVRFKLLLPETRNSTNEVLGALVLKEMGFIVPETFEVKVSLNNVESTMLFQENTRKELLERNKRREGPLFEGDESIVMGGESSLEGQNRGPLELENISLSRVTNSNWFKRGESSQFITLYSFNKLQKEFQNYANNMKILKKGSRNVYTLFSGQEKPINFQDYHFAMLIMNGEHGLRPHNRKFYFNSFSSQLEPIYYDGNLNMLQEIDSKPHPLEGKNLIDKIFDKQKANYINEIFYRYAFKSNYKFEPIRILNKINLDSKIFNDFKSRVYNFNQTHKNFFIESIRNLKTNAKKLQKAIDSNNFINTPSKESNKNNLVYISNVNSHKFKQKHITSIIPYKNKYKLKFSDDTISYLKVEELGNILSRQSKFKKIFYPKTERFIILPTTENEFLRDVKKNNNSIIKFDSSKGINIDINEEKKIIQIKQEHPEDWVLIKNSDLSNWNIYFEGLPLREENIKIKQRFNKYGMTGCLNIYNSYFKNSAINVNNGQCEDSLNIISSNGLIKKIDIENSFADGIDFDFSNLIIEEVVVNNANNDCLDVSGGDYETYSTKLYSCKDKAISIGERSKFVIKLGEIKKSNIGISVKDLSLLKADNLNIANSPICIEAFQKKQEFGGGKATISSLECDGDLREDNHSTLKIK